jgi:hypothetical protein
MDESLYLGQQLGQPRALSAVAYRRSRVDMSLRGRPLAIFVI